MTEKIELLRDADWGNIYKRLVAKTEARIDKFSWRTNTYPLGHTAESLVQEAIESVLNNRSNWNPERGSLEMYLWWVIKRKLNHLFKSKTFHPEGIMEQSIEKTEEEEWKLDFLALEMHDNLLDGDYVDDPEEIIIRREISDEEAELKFFLLLEACNNRPELKDIVHAIYYGHCDPKADSLAEYLQRPVKTIYLQLRALRSRAEKIKKN